MYAERFREFSGLVSRAEKALQRVKTENVKDYGLRGVHVSCLLALHERPEGLTATELASVCGVDRAQISRVTAELRGLDLVCEASPGPRRRYRGAARRRRRCRTSWTKSSSASAGISRRRS